MESATDVKKKKINLAVRYVQTAHTVNEQNEVLLNVTDTVHKP